ncbi:MAG: hypothetical protein NDJ75_07125 [Thermoanaerobaculia bacterium]|nr:hypothetical protein [Thermoanaerobaculia bacterium]
MTNPAATTPAAMREILDRAAALARLTNSEYDDEVETRRKLNAHGLSDDEIARQLATLSANTAGSSAVLTSYSLLHSLQHLDTLLALSPSRRDSAAAVIAIFRCVEICLQCSGALADRMRENLAAGNVARAVANARWRAGLQGLLGQLSEMLAPAGCDAADGARLDLRDSAGFRAYRTATDELQRHLREQWPEEPSEIFARGLDEPRRYVFFHEFVNVGDERCWLSRLCAVRLPGVVAEPGETAGEFYERVVRSAEIGRMLAALETREETDLLPFRVVHQVSELLANHVNERFCAVVGQLLEAPERDLDRAARALAAGNRLLGGAEASVRLMLRALTPAAYQAVRRNLGMVRGTSSVALRRVLFNSTYPLLVRAFKLRLAGYDAATAADDAAIEARAVTALGGATAGERALGDVLRELLVLQQRIRTWRDLHQQLPKTHLGVSPAAERPTVSLSGSESAVDVAHELRKVHARDPIAPLHRAALGGSPPEVHELLGPGEFDEYMAHQTARAVFDVYAEVQERFEARRERAGRRESGGG